MKCYRLTFYSERCIRIECNPKSSQFQDKPSTKFTESANYLSTTKFNQFNISSDNESVEASTPSFTVRLPSPDSSSWVLVINNVEHKGFISVASAQNLGGAARTLDFIHEKNNRIPLEPGLISRCGFTVVDDSKGLVINEEGLFCKREEYYDDFYLFVYGDNYFQCLQDFTKIAGPVPLLPKYIYGIWWSKYWPYKDTQLVEILDQFKEHGVPLSVLCVDMDWHIVKGVKTDGWTGYTWNKEYFPSPEQFLSICHEKGVKVNLNLHPFDGCHSHEDAYNQFAEWMGIDPTSQKPIQFDLTNPKFIEGYFKFLHHPHNNIGVDFWWLDWQQGNKIYDHFPELDPLYYLNYLHWKDQSSISKERPLLLSRWGGLGNHRYQIGFSGDTTGDWQIFEVLPEFTAAGANVLFLWSHDVGGHMHSKQDGELYLRWVQYCVFSPTMRLHCSSNPFESRLPWDFEPNWHYGALEALKLRLLILPYIYSLGFTMHLESIPMVLPLYYYHPKDENCYKMTQEHFFGEHLLIAPFLSKQSSSMMLSRQPTYLPAGHWFDFKSGRHYTGNKWFVNYGTIAEIPIFAKGGAIVPTLLDSNHFFDKSKQFGYGSLCLNVFPCGSSNFVLYEDDGETRNSIPVTTKFSTEWKAVDNSAGCAGQLKLTIHKKEGETKYIKEECSYTILFKSVFGVKIVAAMKNDKPLELKNLSQTQGNFEVRVSLNPNDTLSILIDVESTLQATNLYLEQDLLKLLKNFHSNSHNKRNIVRNMDKIIHSRDKVLQSVPKFEDKDQIRAWIEVLGDCGYHKIPKLDGDYLFICWKNRPNTTIKLESQLDSQLDNFQSETDSDSDDESDELISSEIPITKEMTESGLHHIRVSFGDQIKDEFTFGVQASLPDTKQQDNCILS
uniref:Uncharacterized protein n=1 Tax=Arcella intermedia TaxID=1963864 RepID=A0A6B2KXA5_9EUKA